jgi:hypothetical protein
MRRRRMDDRVELRKTKREETLMKRRNIDPGFLSSPESPQHETPHSAQDIRTEILETVKGICSTNEVKKFNNVQRLRKILSREAKPPIELVVSTGILNTLVEFLKHPE